MATLEPEEIDTLMAAIEEGRVGQTRGPKVSGPVGPVDLTNPARNIPEPMPAFEQMAQRIGRRFGGAISGRIRRRVKASPVLNEKVTFGELMPQLLPPMVVAVMDLGIGPDTALVIIDAQLAESLMLAGLGAKEDDPPVVDEERSLTPLERGVIKRLMSYLADAVTLAFSGMMRLDAKLLRVESDPRMAVTADAKQMAILSTYRVEGDIEGELRLALPFSAFEGVRTKLNSPPALPSERTGADQFTAALTGAMCGVELPVVVELGRVTVSVSELLALEEGAVLTLRTDENTPLPVRIGDRQKLRGRPTVVHGGLGVVVEDLGASPRRPTGPGLSLPPASGVPPTA